MSKPYTKEIEQDELILAAIIAGGMASEREVSPALSDVRPGQRGHQNTFGVYRWNDPQGPCCAVGAGVLYAGLDGITTSVQRAFADAFNVDVGYAVGVSNGFEGVELGINVVIGASYDRGVAVGAAAYDFFHGGEE